MFDISPIIWFLRRHTPTFVSKVELAHGIPGVSYNLRKSGAALIDRKDPKQAIVEIARLGKLIQQENLSAVIFPEGTRSASGQMRPFVTGGVATLLKRAPASRLWYRSRFGERAILTPKAVSAPVLFENVVARLAGYRTQRPHPDEVVKLAQEAIATELGKPV